MVNSFTFKSNDNNYPMLSLATLFSLMANLKSPFAYDVSSSDLKEHKYEKSLYQNASDRTFCHTVLD